MPIRTSLRPRSASRRSPRRTRCCPIPTSGSSTTRCAVSAHSTACRANGRVRRGRERGARPARARPTPNESFEFGDFGGLGDIFSSIFGRGRREEPRERDARGRRGGAVPGRRAGRQDHGDHSGHRALPHLRRQRRRAGRDLVHLPRVQRAGDDLLRPGRVRRQPALPAVSRPRPDPVTALSDLPRRRRCAHRAPGDDHGAPGHGDRLAHPASRPGRGGAGGAPSGDS